MSKKFDLIIKNSNAEIFKNTILESFPQKLFITLTTYCNIKCIFCNNITGKQGTFPLSGFKKIEPMLPYLEIIDWQGGEVFIVDYFKEVFRKISKDFTNIKHIITTNGLLIDAEWAKIFSSTNTVFNFSIDSPVKKTYEQLRKTAKFEQLIKNINTLNSTYKKNNKEPVTSLSAIVMKSNLSELALFPKFCKKYNFKTLNFDFLRPTRVPNEDIILSGDQKALAYLRQIIPKIEEEAKNLGINFEYTFKSLITCQNDNDRENIKNIFSQGFKESLLQDTTSISKQANIINKCELPWKRLFINFDGIVKPDCLCKHPIGNILEDTFEDIWNGETMQEYRRRIMEDTTASWCSEVCISGNVCQRHHTGGD